MATLQYMMVKTTARAGTTLVSEKNRKKFVLLKFELMKEKKPSTHIPKNLTLL